MKRFGPWLAALCFGVVMSQRDGFDGVLMRAAFGACAFVSLGFAIRTRLRPAGFKRDSSDVALA